MRYLVIVFLVVFSFTAYSQYQIEGRVFDHESKKPLEFCNVFINGTTQGTQTDTSGYFNLKGIPFVEIELVISYLGYESFSKVVSFSKGSKLDIEISLMPLVNSLSGFEVKAKVDKTWVKQLKKFKSEFLGSNEFTKKCKIENPYVLEFKETDGIFTATAKESLKIINMALGYELGFEIKEFETSKTDFKIYGNVRFKEMIPKNKHEKAYWDKNRENAYFRSPNFFFKSIVTEQLEQNGFELYVEDPGNLSKRTDNLNLELSKSLMKYVPEDILFNGKHPTLKTISLPDNIEIHNRFLKSPLKTYFQYSNAVSWMSLSKKSIRVTNLGVPLNPAEIMVSGDMNYFKVAGLLPLNFDLNTTPKE